MSTDSERLDFLQAQSFTKWVGYDCEGGYCVWPVFGHKDLRGEIDVAMRVSASRPLGDQT